MARHKLLDTAELYIMHKNEGMTIYAIAQKKGVSFNTVKYHIKKMKKALEKYADN